MFKNGEVRTAVGSRVDPQAPVWTNLAALVPVGTTKVRPSGRRMDPYAAPEPGKEGPDGVVIVPDAKSTIRAVVALYGAKNIRPSGNRFPLTNAKLPGNVPGGVLTSPVRKLNIRAVVAEHGAQYTFPLGKRIPPTYLKVDDPNDADVDVIVEVFGSKRSAQPEDAENGTMNTRPSGSKVVP